MKIENHLFFFLLLILYSCSGQKSEKIVPIKEFMPHVSEADTSSTSPSSTSVESSLSFVSNDSLKSKVKRQNPDLIFLPQEESPLYRKKAIYILNQLDYLDSKNYFFEFHNQPYHYMKWTFKDSTQTINGFYNWLDCFGPNCTTIRLNDTINGQQNAFLLYVSKEEIIYLSSPSNISKEFWEKSPLIPSSQKWIFVLEQKPKGKIKWIKSIVK